MKRALARCLVMAAYGCERKIEKKVESKIIRGEKVMLKSVLDDRQTNFKVFATTATRKHTNHVSIKRPA
jgi:hypothetical protein